MDGNSATVLCYWGGLVQEGPEGVEYNGGSCEPIVVSTKISYDELLERVYSITRWDKGSSQVKIAGRMLTHSNPRRFVNTSIVNSASLSALFSTFQCSDLHCVEIYLSQTRTGGKGKEKVSFVEDNHQSPGASLNHQSQGVRGKERVANGENDSQSRGVSANQQMFQAENHIRLQELDNPGPIDTSVLSLQNDHRSSEIWELRADLLNTPLRVRSGHAWIPDQRLHHYIMEAGFLGVMQIQSITINHALMTALAERWRQETHTFHLPVGEMTVTLEDVGMLLGLPVDGDAVTSSYVDSWSKLCKDELGLTPADKDISGSGLKLKWLTDNFSNLPEADNYAADAYERMLERFARAWLLAAIGAILFPSTSGDVVPAFYLLLLKDLTEVKNYSWGSAVLASLYRGLCKATRPSARELSGCMLLLQLWSWERLHTGRPTMIRSTPRINNGGDGNVAGGDEEDPNAVALHEDIANNLYARVPLGHRWRGRRTYADNPQGSLHYYRSELDAQRDYEVNWRPYEGVNEAEISPLCYDGRTIWRSRVPLINYNVVEWHFPDRVMRQFGMVQRIPTPCNTERTLHGMERTGNHKKDWSDAHHNYVQEWDKRRDYIQNAEVERPEDMARYRDEYMKWYLRITRRRIAPPYVPDPTTPSLKYHNKLASWNKLVETLSKIAETCDSALVKGKLSAETQREYKKIRSSCVSALKSAGEVNGVVESPPKGKGKTSKKRKQACVPLRIGQRESSPGPMESGATKKLKPSEKGKSPLHPSLPTQKGKAMVGPPRPRVARPWETSPGLSEGGRHVVSRGGGETSAQWVTGEVSSPRGVGMSARPGETSQPSPGPRAASQVSLGPSRPRVVSFQELDRPGETSGGSIGMSSRPVEVSLGLSRPRVQGVSFREPGCPRETIEPSCMVSRSGGETSGRSLGPSRPRVVGTSFPGETSGRSIGMSSRPGEVSLGLSGPRVQGVSFREPGRPGETSEPCHMVSRSGGETSGRMVAGEACSLGPFHEPVCLGDTTGRSLGPARLRVVGTSFQEQVRPGETSGRSISMSSRPGETSGGSIGPSSLRVAGEVSVGPSRPRRVWFQEPDRPAETSGGSISMSSRPAETSGGSISMSSRPGEVSLGLSGQRVAAGEDELSRQRRRAELQRRRPPQRR